MIIKKFRIKPENYKDINELIEAGKYDWHNDNIEKNFELEPIKEETELTFVCFQKLMNSSEVLEELKKMNLKPASATEGLYLGAQLPEVQKELRWIAFLGTDKKIPAYDDNRRVVCLSGYGSYRDADLAAWAGVWAGVWFFAASPLESSDTWSLGTNENA